MAVSIDDSNAPKGIPSNGPIAIGNSKGVSSSINLTKDIKKETLHNQANTSFDALRDWFYTYVGSVGNFSGGSSGAVKKSHWKNCVIVGFTAEAANETASTYNDANDAKLRIRTYFGYQNAKIQYTMSRSGYSTQNKTPSTHASSVTFTGMDGDLTGYNLTAQYTSGTTLGATIGMTFNPSRAGQPSIIGSSTVASDGFTYNYSDAGAGTFSSPKFFSIGPPDTSSTNRRNGNNYQYP